MRAKEQISAYQREYRKRPHAIAAAKAHARTRYEQQREYYRNNKDHYKDLSLRSNHGVTLEEFNRILASQGNVCDICKRPQSDFKKNFGLDHCHKTGKIRGVLCDLCNKGIGFLHDDIEKLQSAISYLQRHLDG